MQLEDGDTDHHDEIVSEFSDRIGEAAGRQLAGFHHPNRVRRWTLWLLVEEPSGRGVGPPRLEGRGNLLANKGFDVVTGLEVLKLLEADATFETCPHFRNVVLETP